MKRKRGSWSSEEDEESSDGLELERTESDEEHSTDPGYDYTKDDSLILTDAEEFNGFSLNSLMDRLMADTDSGVHLTAAAMYSLSRCNPLCDVGPFPGLSRDEFMAISIGFDDPDYLGLHGLYLGGRRYELIERGAVDIIRGVMGSGGCAIAKSTKVVIIGIFQPPMTSSECDLVVRDMRDYLASQNF